MFELLLSSGQGIRIFVPDSGAGPEYVTNGDATIGYFGTLTQGEFFTGAEVAAAGITPVTQGTAVNDSTNYWNKFLYNGKVLFVPSKLIRSGVSWDTLYKAGLVYGDAGTGSYPNGSPATAQLRLLSRLDSQGRKRWYKVRLIRCSTNADNATDNWNAKIPETIDAEFACTVERVIPTRNNPVSWAGQGNPGSSFSMTSWKTYPDYAVIDLDNSNYDYLFRSRLKKNDVSGWLPCLELMPLDYNPLPELGNTGPGPTTLVQYDPNNNVGYFGLVEQSELFTPAQVEAVAASAITIGTAVNREATNKWHKFYYKGRITFVPQRVIRNSVSWDSIYAAGFIYGVDGNGKYPAATAVNQLRTIKKTVGDNNWYFKVRSPECSAIDPQTNPPNAINMYASEVSTTIERVVPTLGISQPWATSGLPGGPVLARETMATTVDACATFLGTNTAYQRSSQFKNSATLNWLPVLELMPDDFDPNPTIPDNGPGAKKLVEYNQSTNSGYFGQVPASNMPTLAVIEAAGAKSVGGTANPNAATISWGKFVRNGKVFYFPTAALRTGTDWNSIYNAGFIYGEDGNGKYPTTTPTNQKRTFNYTDVDGTTWIFMVRATSMSSVDPYSHTASGPQATASEYSQAIQNMYAGSPLAWGNYAKVEALGKETNGTYTTSGAMTSSAAFNAISNWPKDGSAGKKNWLPVLELIGKV